MVFCYSDFAYFSIARGLSRASAEGGLARSAMSLALLRILGMLASCPRNPTPRVSMIVYRLACDREHQFEGWFQSGADYDRQSQDGAILCPVCESVVVSRLPSAPHVQTGRERITDGTVSEEPMKLHELWRMLHAATEDVGDAFPAEARRIHYREAPQRNIRGRASVAAIGELHEEGIAVLTLPDPSKLH